MTENVAHSGAVQPDARPAGPGRAAQDLDHQLLVDLRDHRTRHHRARPADQHRPGQLASSGFAKEQQGQPIPDFGPPPGVPVEGGPSPEEMERMREEYLESIDLARILVRSAANIYTSGQFFGLLFMVILGALIVTNEFFHQTATTTFLTVPHRTKVIVSKLTAAVLLASGFWFVTTAIDLAVGSIYFAAEGYAIPLTDWPVMRSVLMNLLAYVIWAVLGVGLGALIRSQLGATLTGAAFYLLSYPGRVRALRHHPRVRDPGGLGVERHRRGARRRLTDHDLARADPDRVRAPTARPGGSGPSCWSGTASSPACSAP